MGSGLDWWALSLLSQQPLPLPPLPARAGDTDCSKLKYAVHIVPLLPSTSPWVLHHHVELCQEEEKEF